MEEIFDKIDADELIKGPSLLVSFIMNCLNGCFRMSVKNRQPLC